MNKKNRNLSVAEYFLIIQKEYLIAEFRKKIYFSKNDKLWMAKGIKLIILLKETD
jgi:hypothetical protein